MAPVPVAAIPAAEASDAPATVDDHYTKFQSLCQIDLLQFGS
jgi:hypothetical protein